jgi:hypothetical protein
MDKSDISKGKTFAFVLYNVTIQLTEIIILTLKRAVVTACSTSLNFLTLRMHLYISSGSQEKILLFP